MIFGIGADIVEKGRIAGILDRFGERFAARVLSAVEMEKFRSASDRPSYLAKRFAAKEAFSKAMGTGIRYPVLLGSISVVNDELGKPMFELDSTLEQHLRRLGIGGRHLSISDEKNLACAFVVLEKE